MSVASRDSGLRRVSRITRWIAAAGVALTGMFAVMVAKAQPGKTATNQSPAAGTQGTTTPATTSQDTSGLQPPVLPPVASRGSGQVVSGGS